jgi:AcrR family transcriptional regulator
VARQRQDPSFRATEAFLKAPRDSDSALRRERIREAARERFLDQGYVGTSLRQIAEDADSSPSNILRIFGDKYGLLEDIYDHSYRVALTWLERVDAASYRTPVERLVGGVREVVQSGIQEPAVGDFLIANSGYTEFLLGPPERSAPPRRSQVQFEAWFEEAAETCTRPEWAISGAALGGVMVGVIERLLLSAYLHENGPSVYKFDFDLDAACDLLQAMLNAPASPRHPWSQSLRSAIRELSFVWENTSRDRLTASAWLQFAQNGYVSTSSQVIATEAGTSESEFFRQFRNGKFQVLQAIYDRCFSLVQEELEQIDTPDPRQALCAGAEVIWTFCDVHPAVARFLAFNSGNADSLLLMPRKLAHKDNRTALTKGMAAYFAWFNDRSWAALPSGLRDSYGEAAGQIMIGLVERPMLDWVRAEDHGLASTITRDEAMGAVVLFAEALGSLEILP